MCRMLDLTPTGVSNFLRYRLKFGLIYLSYDDKMIEKEGIDLLTLKDLQQICDSRGMPVYQISKKRLNQQLRQWMDLQSNEQVPPSLILLSRLFCFTENIPTSDLLKYPDVNEIIERIMNELNNYLKEKMKNYEENVVDTAPILTDTTGIKEENVKKMKKDIETKELVYENTAKETELINDGIGVINKLQNMFLFTEEFLGKINDDHDGPIRLDIVLKVLEQFGTEHFKLSTEEMDLIKKLIFKKGKMETIEKMNNKPM